LSETKNAVGYSRVVEKTSAAGLGMPNGIFFRRFVQQKLGAMHLLADAFSKTKPILLCRALFSHFFSVHLFLFLPLFFLPIYFPKTSS